MKIIVLKLKLYLIIFGLKFMKIIVVDKIYEIF